MTIRYECSECGAGLKIKDELAGTKGKCPKCKTKFIVPDPESPAPVVAGSTGEAVRKKSMADWLAEEDVNSPADESSADLPPVDEPDELTEDPTAALFDDFETPSVFVPDEPDPAEAKTEPKKKKRDRKSRDKKKTSTAASTAGSAQALLNATAEKKRMQSGMPDVNDDDDEESFTVGAIKFYGSRVVLPAIAFLAVCYFSYSWLASASLKLPPLGQVSGVVTMDNKPLAGVYVIFEREFAPTEERFNASAGGVTNADGEYELIFSTVHGIYGAVVGPNIVRIQSEGAVFIPVRYNMATDLKVEVESSNDSMDFSLTSSN